MHSFSSISFKISRGRTPLPAKVSTSAFFSIGTRILREPGVFKRVIKCAHFPSFLGKNFSGHLSVTLAIKRVDSLRKRPVKGNCFYHYFEKRMLFLLRLLFRPPRSSSMSKYTIQPHLDAQLVRTKTFICVVVVFIHADSQK